MKSVLLKMTIIGLALSATLGSPVQPEPRKFVYQVGFPSVRRYPVFPDRHFELDQSHVLKLAAEKNKDLKNELLPDITPTKKPGMTQPEGLEAAEMDFLAENETSTDSWNPVDSDLTTTSSRFFTTSTPAPETTSTSSISSFEGTSAPVEGGFTPSTFFFTPHQELPGSGFGNEEESSSIPSSSVFGAEDPSSIPSSSVFGNEDPSSIPSSSFFGNEDPSSIPSSSVFGSEDPSSDPSSRPSIFDNTDPSSRPATFDSESPSSSSSFFESELPSSGPEHSIFESSNIQDEPQELPTGPFRFFSDNVDGDNSVFPEGPLTHEEGGDFSAREEDSHFGVFTEGPEESTDMPMTTDLPRHAFMEMEEETMADSTASPVEEGFAELSENRTDSPLVDEVATESAWDPVTQEIYTTEEADVFL